MAATPQNRVRLRHNRNNNRSFQIIPVMILILACSISFFAGTLWSIHAGIIHCNNNNGDTKSGPSQLSSVQSQRGVIEKLKNEYEQKILELKQKVHEQQQQQQEQQEKSNHEDEEEDGEDEDEEEAQLTGKNRMFPETMQRYAVGMASVDKENFFDTIPIGVAMDEPMPKDKDVLVLYQTHDTLPNKHKSIPNDRSIRHIDTTREAVQNCEFLNVLLTHHDHRRNQCIALVPQYESFHLYRYGRVPPGRNAAKLDRTKPLRLISRGYEANGRDNFHPPNLNEIQASWSMLRTFLGQVDDIQLQLKPILQRIASQNTVIVMVCNYGQSELLMNFVCAARAKNFDMSMILVFPTDTETKELAESMGLTTYYDERVFSDISSEEAKQYGDRYFVQMMWAKAIVVALVSLCGYDFLFQDVDIIWYQHPLRDYFHNKDVSQKKGLGRYDLIFQDDGAHSQRYTPLSANTGFYYVRYNDKTQFLLTSVLLAGDLIERTNSHQQAFIAKMNEYSSLVGLRVKVVSRDDEDQPGGYHFHQKTGKFLRAFFRGEKHPVIFHMSWTKNKDNKILFFKQMGEWYLRDKCVHKNANELLLNGNNDNTEDLVGSCCSAEALFSCHYRDKPSLHPCKDSPPIDEGKPSWWK